MVRNDTPEGDMLGNLGRILAGVGMFAMVAREVIAANKRGHEVDQRPGTRAFAAFLHERRAPRRKPPEAGLPVPAIPPRGPLPKQGGAAAELDFEV